MPRRKTLLDILSEQQLLGKDQITPILKEVKNTKATVLEVIKRQKLVADKQLAKALSEHLGLPYIDLTDVDLQKEALKIIPPESAKTYKFYPFFFDPKKNKVKVAMVDPQNLKALEALEFITKSRGLTSEIHVTDEVGFNGALRSYEEGLSQQVNKALKARSQEKAEEAAKLKGKEKNNVREQDLEAEAPIIKLVDAIIKHAVEDRASDIHVEPQTDKLRVRYRIDGLLQTSVILPKKIQEAVTARLKVMARLKIDESRVPQDGRFNLEVLGKTYDFRVSVIPTVSGEKIVMRILDKSKVNLTLEQIGLSGKRLKDVESAYKKPYGMIVVTGPTGSGKSTTLYSIVNLLNKEEVNISTLEDPVEYHIAGLTQSQVNPDVKFGFASGLRSLLRQDPDIIMLGEIRDRETGEMAVHAALTGHLVLSTLHTNTAEGAVPRLVDMGLESFLLVSSLELIIAQRLVRRICPDCKVVAKIDNRIKAETVRELADLSSLETKGLEKEIKALKFYTGKGCKKCGKKGFRGRLAIFSVLPISSSIEEIILSSPSADKIGKVAKQEGVISMRQDGIIKAIKGQTSLDEVFAKTIEAEEDKNKEAKREKNNGTKDD